MYFGELRIKEFLENVNGVVGGTLQQDAKNRWYNREYKWEEDDEGNVLITPLSDTGHTVKLPATISLDESLIAFFGLYSGDGAKGSELANSDGKVVTNISFSQREPNLVKFAIEQFRKIFNDDIHFTFSLGEDSAYFMGGEGLKLLHEYYGVSNLPK
ncbi:hypothetical protein AC739_19550, partial [Planococcus glaciei]|uniref:hypothetical protein n=1 Tax=Planococcus glaciei TaxID=459472 RepID=UPI0006C416E4